LAKQTGLTLSVLQTFPTFLFSADIIISDGNHKYSNDTDYYVCQNVDKNLILSCPNTERVKSLNKSKAGWLP